jgi:predicted lipoprotein with Yx(FWY)xxD motif
MKFPRLILSVLVGLVLLVTACSPQATPVAAPTKMPATQPPEATATSAPVEGSAVMLGKSDALGSFLVDAKGMTLYLYTKDTPNTSACYDKCATSWPPLLTSGDPIANEGVDAGMLGTTTRTDGSLQVTYNGWPLYYFAKDAAPGDTTGQDVGSVWYVVSAAGEKVESAPQATEPPVVVAAAIVNLGRTDALGSFLVDAKSMTLYLYTKDTPNTSTCYDQCATNWPPLLTTADPIAGEGVDAALLGTTTRTDGSIQVTYNGWPLYYYAKDAAPGDATGQDVGSVWYVVSAAGEQIMNP